MDKKAYCYFNIVDRWHVEESRHFCVYGTHHEIVKYQWMKMAELARRIRKEVGVENWGNSY